MIYRILYDLHMLDLPLMNMRVHDKRFGMQSILSVRSYNVDEGGGGVNKYEDSVPGSWPALPLFMAPVLVSDALCLAVSSCSESLLKRNLQPLLLCLLMHAN